MSSGKGDTYPSSNPKYVWRELDTEEKKRVQEAHGENSKIRDLLTTSPSLITMPRYFLTLQDRIYNFKVRSDDVWVVTHPKAGTTWTQELAWLVLNKADTETAQSQSLWKERSLFIGATVYLHKDDPESSEEFFSRIDELPSPRLIKSHLPFELLPPHLLDTCKVINVCRNVKDTVVSSFHHKKVFKFYDCKADFLSHARNYKDGLEYYGGYWPMLESGLKRSSSPNLLILWYEDMKKDQKSAIRQIVNHLQVNGDEAMVDKINSFMEFENYKKKSTVNREADLFNEGKGSFLRKGEVGDWKTLFSCELSEEYDNWIRDNLGRLKITHNRIVDKFQLLETATKQTFSSCL